MQSVVIPIDFTKRSDSALDYAIALFSSQSIQFILLHSYSTISANELLISVDDIIEKDICHKLDEKVEYIRSKTGSEKINVIRICERNDLISSIRKVVSKYHAELLIVGSDGEDSWNDGYFPSEGKTLNIIDEINLPTLVVPIHQQIQKPQNVLFATVLDGIHNSKEVNPLIEMIKECNAHIDILNVGGTGSNTNELDQDLKKTINGYFVKTNYDLHTVVDNDIQLAIGKFSEEHNNDFICIIYRKHGFIETVFKPGVSKKIINKTQKPILALKYDTSI